MNQAAIYKLQLALAAANVAQLEVPTIRRSYYSNGSPKAMFVCDENRRKLHISKNQFLV